MTRMQKALCESMKEYYYRTAMNVDVISIMITREGLKELIDALEKCDTCIARHYLENPNERRTDEQTDNKSNH